ncbi:hypothetical protein DPMN_109609 [Dreissena polymorpha]|uniref:Uncharacterized protein n=1 Tax=Dreissena polymorpha TaxID=45954 RepID=A0A9D4KB40_DREPO|nr:hypothetical protein DPMN_109609 [Dreissena polymorpha]
MMIEQKMKSATSPSSHETNVLTKFHEDWTKNVTLRVFICFPAPDGHVLSPIWTIFGLVRDINKTNVLTKFHDDWLNILTSRLFTRKTAPPTGGHVFQRTRTTFELNQHIITTNSIIGTHLLTKFYEDRTRNVSSRVFPNQMWTDGRTMDKDRS